MRKFIFILFVCVLLSSSAAYSENTADEFNAEGVKYFQEKQYDSALESFQKALNIDPKSTDALFNMGGVYSKKGEYDKAVENFQKLVLLKPDDGGAYYALAVADYFSYKYDEAIKNYDKSQALNFEPEKSKRLGNLLEHLRYKERDFGYSSLLDKNANEIVVKIKGVISGDNLLIKDTFNYLEPIADVSKKGMFKSVEIKFKGVLADKKGVEQLWTLHWDDNTQKTFRVTYKYSNSGGTDIEVTEEINK
ncbi:MAG: tetratricopeptide repeat protein [Candidatus Omnitrophica bacterium]|nr:tetratricopeptide repeat protein [Candidatus Omnitrophota bacterium]